MFLLLGVVGCGRINYQPRDVSLVDAMDAMSGDAADAGVDAMNADAFVAEDAGADATDALDPCARCDINATCTLGACSCNVGFMGDGLTCAPEVGFGGVEAYVKASNAGPGDWFGEAIALSGDGLTLAVGARQEDGSGTGVNPPSDEGVGESGAVYIYRRVADAWTFEAYLKASNGPGLQDGFGTALSLSDDGDTLAVGAHLEDGAGTGVNPPSDEAAARSGAVYIFERTGSTWSAEAYLKASNTGSADEFGYTVALSGDGTTLAVGALREDGAGTGIDPAVDEGATDSGAVYVFHRTVDWSLQGYLKASNTGPDDFFGSALAISDDGSTLAVASIGEDGSGTGLNPASDEAANGSGAVYLYERSGSTWAFDAYLKARNTRSNDRFGRSVSLSGDGAVLAVGADGEQGAGRGVNPDYVPTSVGAGAAYVYQHTSTWAFEAYIKAHNTGAFDSFGFNVALSGDGRVLVVGAYQEDGSGTGVNPASDEAADASGAAYAFRRRGDGAWAFDAYLKTSNTSANDQLGRSLSLSHDGRVLAAGVWWEDGSGTGINPPLNEAADGSGAAYIFR